MSLEYQLLNPPEYPIIYWIVLYDRLEAWDTSGNRLPEKDRFNCATCRNSGSKVCACLGWKPKESNPFPPRMLYKISVTVLSQLAISFCDSNIT